MKNLFNSSAMSAISASLLLISSFIAGAQSLPNVQKESVLAPVNIKIDGKATEWGDKFKAYNHATDVFYTLCNDDENLYLTVQTTKHDIVDKIIRGGITFTANHTNDKKDKNPVKITYPVLRNADMVTVANAFARKAFQQLDDNNKIVRPDSNFNELNALLDSKSKLINISGISEIKDDAISVYNETGIRAASKFDKKLVYTIELAIPLKYLALTNVGPFSYQIKVNAPYGFDSPPPPGAHGPPAPPMMITATATTDFWGEYTLAKK